MSREIIILAAHDDGSGAHVTMCHICHGLLNAARKEERGKKLLIVYLHSSSWEKDWAEDLWKEKSDNETLITEPLDNWPQQNTLDKLHSIWIKVDNALTFVKKDGSLDVSETRKKLTSYRTETGINTWANPLRIIPINDVVLTIEMGVPQLSKWAKNYKVPAISVGDMFWSRTLRECLQGAGEYGEDVRNALSVIADCETSATEGWLLPIIAPRDYIDFFAQEDIPVLTLPGFFGSKPDETSKQNAQKTLKVGSKKLVVMSAGTTGVWLDVYRSFGELVKEKQSRNKVDFVLLYPTSGGLVLINEGKERLISQPASLVPYYCNANLGITRGGVTITEFIASEIPFIVVQEPEHWLSRVQQRQTRGARLSHSCSLSRLKNPTEAFKVIKKCLDSPENEQMKARMNTFQFEIGEWWAKYLLGAYIK